MYTSNRTTPKSLKSPQASSTIVSDGQPRFGVGHIELKDLYLLELRQWRSTVQPLLGVADRYREDVLGASTSNCWSSSNGSYNIQAPPPQLAEEKSGQSSLMPVDPIVSPSTADFRCPTCGNVMIAGGIPMNSSAFSEQSVMTAYRSF